jgi:hypothetical protein
MKKVTLNPQWLFVITLALMVIYSCNDEGPESSEPVDTTVVKIDTVVIKLDTVD